MEESTLKKLLKQVQTGDVSIGDALSRLRNLPFESLGFAHIDHHRQLRCGYPEVIFCQNKTIEQVETIFDRLAQVGGNILATRATAEMFERVRARYPKAEFNEAAPRDHAPPEEPQSPHRPARRHCQRRHGGYPGGRRGPCHVRDHEPAGRDLL